MVGTSREQLRALADNMLNERLYFGHERVARGVLALLDEVDLREARALAKDGDVYRVRVGTWEAMRASILRQLVDEAGSIRKAALVLEVPRSTLGNWIREVEAFEAKRGSR